MATFQYKISVFQGQFHTISAFEYDKVEIKALDKGILPREKWHLDCNSQYFARVKPAEIIKFQSQNLDLLLKNH